MIDSGLLRRRTHAAATPPVVGLIWLVQVIHYPLFAAHWMIGE